MKLIIFLTTFLTLSTQIVADQSLIKVGYADYRPYSFSESGHPTGIEVDVLNQVAERLNFKIHHEILPWKRVQMMVEHGKLDAFVAVSTPDRTKYAVAGKQSIALGNVSLFVRKDRFSSVDSFILEDLKKLRLAAIRGSGWAKKNLKVISVRYVNSMDTVTQMLVLSRVDGVVENSFILADYLKQHDLKREIKEIEIDFPPLKLVILVSKLSVFSSKVGQIDMTIQKLHSEGVIDQIYNKYR